MKVLGIDPGFKTTGYGLLEVEGTAVRLVETGLIEPKPKDLVEFRLQTVYQLLGELLEEHKPDVMVLEKLYAHAQHPATAFKLGHVRGVICLLCAKHKMTLVEESPKRVRKAVTGNGNASKQQTKAMVAKLLHIPQERLTYDASDALALALGYIQMKR